MYGSAEDQVDSVIVEPFVVLQGKTLDEREVRLVVLANVVELLGVFGIYPCTHPRLGSHLLDDVSQGASCP